MASMGIAKYRKQSISPPETSPDFQSERTTEDFISNSEIDRAKRFDYLLKQAELYAHFMMPAYVGALGEKDDQPADANFAEMKPSKRTRKPKLMPNFFTPKTRNDGSKDTSIAGGFDKQISRFEESPSFIKGGTMRDYQVRGLNWLISLNENGINGILADEMGLGKTIQTIALLGYLKTFRNHPGPHLVVAPKSTLTNWINEFEKWCPSLKAVCLIGLQKEREIFIKSVFKPRKWNVCITSYEMVLKEKLLLRRVNWHYLIIDEAQRIKNENSLLSEYIRTFNSSNRLLLTGTPLQNNLHELWSLLNFLLPDVFASSEDFDSWFNTNNCFGDQNLVDRLHSVLRPFLLRRIKADVEKGLAPKMELKIYVPLTKLQRTWYKKILLQEIDVIQMNNGRTAKTRLQNTLMQLRKVCNHPYIFFGAEEPPFSNATIAEHSGKMIMLDRLLPKLKLQGSRILIFCQMTRMMDILEDYFSWKEYEYCRLDGQTDHEVRQKSINEFNSPNSKQFIFILSTRAGGLGINLATADVVILYDSDWNPQMDLQAMDRCHRIGQTKEVRVFRLITENTIEEKIVERAEVKLRLDRMVIQEGRLVDRSTTQSNSDDILNIVRFGADHILKSTDDVTVTDEDIDTILAKSQLRTEEMEQRLSSLGEGDLRSFAVEAVAPVESQPISAHISVFQFEGQDYRVLRQRKKQNEEIQVLDSTRRERFKSSIRLTDSEVENVNDSEVHQSSKQLTPFTKPKNVFDHFFCSYRCMELYRQEMDYFKKISSYKVQLIQTLPIAEATSIASSEEDRLRSAIPLTQSELWEKNICFAEGFCYWTKKQFAKFLTAIKQHGRDNLQLIAYDVPGKTTEEVVAFCDVFWQRCHELYDFENIMESAGMIDLVYERRAQLKVLLNAKFAQYKGVQNVKVKYVPENLKGIRFSEEHDQQILLTLQRIGLDTKNVFGILHDTIINSSDYDHFLRARTPKELHARANMLLTMISQESTSQDHLVDEAIEVDQQSCVERDNPTKSSGINPVGTNTPDMGRVMQPRKRKLFGRDGEHSSPSSKMLKTENSK